MKLLNEIFGTEEINESRNHNVICIVLYRLKVTQMGYFYFVTMVGGNKIHNNYNLIERKLYVKTRDMKNGLVMKTY